MFRPVIPMNNAARWSALRIVMLFCRRRNLFRCPRIFVIRKYPLKVTIPNLSTAQQPKHVHSTAVVAEADYSPAAGTPAQPTVAGKASASLLKRCSRIWCRMTSCRRSPSSARHRRLPETTVSADATPADIAVVAAPPASVAPQQPAPLTPAHAAAKTHD